MFSVIIVPDGCRGPEEQHRLEPGHTLRFGRTAPAGSGLAVPHPAVACAAGEITATGAFWTLTNFSRDQSYVVENPESPGERLTVAPGRADAPVPFEFARVRLCARDPRPGCGFDVLAPRHDYLAADGGPRGPGGTLDAAGDGEGAGAAAETEDWLFDPFPRPYPLDHTCRYFLVLAALCEEALRAGDTTACDAPGADQPGTRHGSRPGTRHGSRPGTRLGDQPHARHADQPKAPCVEELTERLRPVWPEVTATAVRWNLDYLRMKLGLRAQDGPEAARAALVRFALRFDLVHEGHLALLGGQLV
ncbi:hypothetical protein [Streptomyces sp. PU-14G]|uniref:hypothetical protein n=1 Tax=Streptomyces sp. PU-14G TaxID=2800808 RepID=UPI0034DE32F5